MSTKIVGTVAFAVRLEIGVTQNVDPNSSASLLRMAEMLLNTKLKETVEKTVGAVGKVKILEAQVKITPEEIIPGSG